MRATQTLIGAAHAASLIPVRRRFEQACTDPARAQSKRLERFCARHRDTSYGRAIGLERVDGIAAFQRRVPVRGYEELEPWIERAAAGEPGVFSFEPIRVFEATSGSTRSRKLIPYTDAFLREFSAAAGPWLLDLYRHGPGVLGRTSYWSVSPSVGTRNSTQSGIPIGFEDDTQYFGRVERWGIQRLMSVPSSVARIDDTDRWRFATARHLLADEHLGFISVWSPSFLTALMEFIRADFESLLSQLPATRARTLRRRIEREGGIRGDVLWPKLGLISCWADGHAASTMSKIRLDFPGVGLQPKGVLATEGVLSIPLFAAKSEGSVVAAASHFLEFIDLEHPRSAPRLVHELRIGGHYTPLLTTGNGFARYRLNDHITCVGHYRATPLIRFVGKLDRTSDLHGEKLTAALVEPRVAEALAAACIDPEFVLFAPSDGRYCLFLETPRSDLAAVAECLEALLCEIFHYRRCRELAQLGAVEVVPVTNGWRRYEQACIARGLRVGDIKPTLFDTRTDWARALGRSLSVVSA
ncbi:MAG: GH3 auxin-responsive promoter family protein [Myxococcota bacterium]